MSAALWYAGRGTGVSALVLLSLVVVLGLLVRSGWSSPALPRFAASAVHRTTSRTGVGLLVTHVLSLLLDPYAQLRLVDLAVPFLGTYRPVRQGLGTLALDLVVLLVASSLLRDRLGRRTWRALHWTAYLCWPVAVVHAVGNGTDGTSAWLLAVVGACAAAVAGALVVRVRAGRGGIGFRARGAAAGVPRGTARSPGGPAMSAPQRLLGAAAPTLADHERLLGALPDVDGATLLRPVADAGLTGRGRAAFSTARKLASVAAGGEPVVVAKGAEGEPASSKDRVLLSSAPHVVLDGLQ